MSAITGKPTQRMSSVTILDQKAPLALTREEESSTTTTKTTTALSVLSYNVLLPNSSDGWWCYKMYSPRLSVPVTEEQTSWPHRKALLAKTIAEADADVVCIQETNEKSFDDDFSFMAELGYSECELFKKGRFRPATFWRPDRVALDATPLHRDRCLVTLFRVRDQNNRRRRLR